jgi:hypothetical protein
MKGDLMMAKRDKYHVVHKDDKWKVEKEQGKRASSVHDTKAEAEKAAKELAKSQPNPSQVIVHKMNGTIQTENTYGNDPFPPKG